MKKVFGLYFLLLLNSYCFGDPPKGYYTSTGTITTTHFEIYWEKDYSDYDYSTDTWIDKIKTYLEETWNFETPYGNPPGTPANKIRVDVYDHIRQEGSYATTQWWYGNFPVINLDNDYIGTQYGTPDDALKMIIAHEFFHCVQQKYDTVSSYIGDWIHEGTARWMSDEMSNNKNWGLNAYLLLNNGAELFFANPSTSLDQQNPYSTEIFWLYLAEQKGSSIIKTVWDKFQSNWQTDILKSIGQALGDADFGDNFKTLFKNFSLACYMKDDATHGFTDDGASQLPDVAQISPTDDTDDYYIDTFDEATGKIAPKERTLNHLAANYVPISKPATLTEKTTIYIFADGVTDADWGFWVVKVLNDGTKQPEEIILDGTTFEGNKIYGNFDGSELTDIKDSFNTQPTEKSR